MVPEPNQNPISPDLPLDTPDSDTDSLSISEAAAKLRLRAVDILENLSDAFVALDTEWRIVYANRQACAINRKPLEQFAGKTHWEEWPVSVGTEMERQYRRAMTEQVEVHFAHYYKAEPYDIWVEVDAYPSPDGLNIFYRDISERKQSEDALRTSVQRFRQMADAIPHIAWTTGADGNVDYYNQRWYDYSGLTFEETRDWGWAKAIHPDDLAHAGGVWQAAVTAGTVSEVEYRLRRADGEYRLHLGRSVPVRDGNQIVKWVGTATDIEDRRLAEEALRHSREDLQFAINAGQLGTFYCNWPFDKIIWNETCKQHFFLPPDAEVDFALFYSLLHPDDRAPTRQAIDRAMAEHVEYNVEYRTLAPDGRTRWVNAVGRGYYNTDGVPLRFDGITMDISVRKETERQLRARVEREALINHIGQAIRASLDIERIQEIAAVALGKMLGLDRCFYVTYDLAHDMCHAGRDYRRSDLPSVAGEYRISTYQTVLDQLFAEGTAVIDDVRQSRLSASAAAVQESFGQRATLAVPYFDNGVLVAALFAATTEPRIWTADEMSLVEQVATMTRSAVEAAGIRRREHLVAEQLSAALQPAAPRSVPGLELAEYYRPALDDQGVGGDFSDVFSIDKGTTFLVVGDLSGKGLAAASQVAMVRHMLRFSLYNGRTVAGPVTRLNATLVDHNLLDGFATLFVGRYDAPTRMLTYVNAGQDVGLLLRKATGQVETLLPTGPILGAFDVIAFDETTITLEAGDVLALSTDGLTEAGPSRTALLTGDGVAALLKSQADQTEAQAIVDGLIAGVDTYAERGIRDDQCLLVAVVRTGLSRNGEGEE